MHLEYEFFELPLTDDGAAFNFFMGRKHEGSGINIQHAEDLEKEALREGASRVAGDATAGTGRIVVGAELELIAEIWGHT